MEQSTLESVEGAFGTTIRVGDLIAYPGRRGSGMWMTCAVVTGIKMAAGRWSNKKKPVLMVTTIATVWQVDDYMYQPRKTTVSVLDRVVPLDPEAIDPEDPILDVLTSFELGQHAAVARWPFPERP